MATIVGSAAGGNWNAGGSWVGGIIPSATSDVQLDATSGNITVNVTSACRSINCTGYVGTLAQTAALNVGDATAGTGNIAFKLVAGMTYTSGAGVSFVSTNATQQSVDFGGKTVNTAGFTGVGGSWQLASAIVVSNTLTFGAGALDTNNQAVTCNIFSSSSGTTRSLTLGSSTVTCQQNSTAAISFIAAGMTITPGTSSIVLNGTAQTFGGGGLTFWNVSFTNVSPTGTVVSGSNTFNNLTFAPSGAIKTHAITFAANQTVSGVLTLSGNTAINRVLVKSDILGTPRTLTCNGTITTQHSDWQDITGAGSASWNLAAITGLSGDCGGNSGITLTTPTTQTSTGTASFTWSTHGWTTHVPLPQDTVSIPNAFIATRVVTVDMPRLGKNITLTCTGNPSITLSADTVVYGNWTFSGTNTTAGSFTFTLAGRSAQTFTSNGNAIAYAINVTSAGGTYTLQDNITTASTPSYGCTSGTLDLNGKTISTINGFTLGATSLTSALKLSGGTLNCSTVSASVATTRSVDFGAGGIINLLSTAATAVWSVAGAGFTTSGTGTIKINAASASARTFGGGGFTYPTLDYTVAGSTGTLTLTGSNTFDTVNFSDVTNARSLLLTAATTTTVTNFNVQGTAGKLMTVDSATAASHNLAKSSGTASCDYLSIKNSHAAGGAAWYAGANSTDVSGNTGWIFTPPPSSSGSLLLMGVG